MSLRRIVQNRVTYALLSPRTRNALRAVARARRRLRGARPQVLYFHQVDDPYSQLASQILSRFAESYDVELQIRLANPPSDETAPDRERLITYSRRDAAAIAVPYGVAFNDLGRQPIPENCDLAAKILAAHLGAAIFAKLAPRVGEALWNDDTASLQQIAAAFPPADAATTACALTSGTKERERLRHYSSATFYYEGEWYWGVDRLHYLESRLTAEGLRLVGGDEPIVPRLDVGAERPEGASKNITLEYFPSLRSPYSAISTARTFELADRLSVKLVLKPVLPMVMRGLPVPAAKGIYILRDTKREAEKLGVPFGNLFDPVGRPVERAFSLYPFACEKGRGPEFLEAFLLDSFGGGIDTRTDSGLQHVVERAGLEWAEGRKRLDGDQWRDELEENRRHMLEAGLWGVPSYRVRSEGESDFTTWGQDRIWLVEKELLRRLQD